MTKSVDALSDGFSTSAKNPLIFVLSLWPMVIHLVFAFLATVVFRLRYWWFYGARNPYLLWGGYFLASIVGFIACSVAVDMTNDAISKRPVDFKKSLSAAMGQPGDLMFKAIIWAVFLMTFILIPVALFLVAIVVIEETDAFEGIKRAFSFFVTNIKEAIVLIIVPIVTSIVFVQGFLFIPLVGIYVGAVVHWILILIFTVASVHLYFSLREAFPPPPPPPPPPPRAP